MHDDKWHLSPKTAPLLSFTSHNEKVGKEGGVVQTRRRRKSEQSCRQGPLLPSDWSPQEEMVHSFIVPIYTSSPDLRQVQIYTRSRFIAATDLHQSHGLCLQWHQAVPLWRHLYFLNSFRPIVKCFRLRSRAGTFSQAMCEAALVKGLLGGFGCGAFKWPDTQIPPRPPPSL